MARRPRRISVWIAALAALLLPGSSLAAPALSGLVTTSDEPLEATKVFAYQLADLSLTQVVTGADGAFAFDDLPAGLYKIIALKSGFVPTVIGLTRVSAEAQQFLELELAADEPGEAEAVTDFWTIRESVPADVLREIDIAAQTESPMAPSISLAQPLDRFNASMTAMTGIDERLVEAQLTGGQVDLAGELNAVKIGLSGDFWDLAPVSSDVDQGGQSRQLSLRVTGRDNSQLQLSSNSNYLLGPLPTGEAREIGFEDYRISWSRPFGAKARSDFSARYTSENNFYRTGPIDSAVAPEESSSWRVEGSLSTAVSRRNDLRTGFRYREHQSRYDPLAGTPEFGLPEQAVELYGLGGYQASPAVVLEYGLYSRLRDGTLSLAPRGGVVMQMGEHWQASSSATHSIHDSTERSWYDFAPAFRSEFETCDAAEEYCYEFQISRSWNDDDSFSVGTVHRKFSEPLRLFFSEEFFDHLQSLYLVEGDSLPQLQVAATRRLSPNVLTTLESNIARGGGGLLYSETDEPLENEVAYLVTSIDTQFERTSTGVFLAFHRLEQELSPLQDLGLDPELVTQQVEIERLQLMLTQDLDLLFDLASNWAVRLNMEVSRGLSPESADEDELQKRFMGGVAVSF